MAEKQYHIRTTLNDGTVMTNPWDSTLLENKVHAAQVQKLTARIEKVTVDPKIEDVGERFDKAELVEIIWEPKLNPAVAKEISAKDAEIEKLKEQLKKAEAKAKK